MRYFEKLTELYEKIVATELSGAKIPLEAAIGKGVDILAGCSKAGKIAIIGNGGSAAIASHVATDFIRSVGVPAAVFSDLALMTCISNDFGYDHVYERPLAVCLAPEDVLIAISSSGKSTNILRAVDVAKKKGIPVITMTGFSEDNPLRTLGDLNFFVSSSHYGNVEIVHLSLCHCLSDTMIEKRKDG
jgi:D-sedoheptulose 7-phosphate isomerase